MTTSKPLFDQEFALSQLGGNSDLLKRMLVRFEQEFTTVPEEVRTLIDKNEIKEAKMKVHTTKGLSGNLGLMALYESAKILDQHLREGSHTEALLEEFARIMKDTCVVLQNVDLATNTPAEFTTEVADNQHYEEFVQRLERHEFIDDATLHNYVNSLNMSEEDKKQLVSLVEELQYAKAIEIIRKLA